MHYRVDWTEQKKYMQDLLNASFSLFANAYWGTIGNNNWWWAPDDEKNYMK